MRLKPVCKFFLQGKCAFGPKCRYRHHGPGLTGIAFAPHVPPAGSSQETLHPIQPPGTMQAVVSPDMKTTLTAGIVPTNIELLLSSKTALQIDRVDTMPQVTIVSLRLPRKIYEAHIARLKRTAGEIWKQHKVRVHIKEPKEMAGASEVVEMTLKATGQKALAAAKKMLDHVVTPDLHRRLTPRPKQTKQTHRIKLTKTKAYLQALKQIKKSRDTYGEDVVKLDEKSDPHAVIVCGDTVLLRKVERFIRDAPLPANKQVVCAICEDNPEDFLRVSGCKHVACLECFTNHCTIDIGAKLPLRCFATGCETLMSIDQLRSTLTTDEMDRLVAEAVKGYIRRHPNLYTQCVGLDCDAWYERSTAKEEHICPSCLTANCATRTVIYHSGETCDEYKLRTAKEQEDALETWMKEKGAKHCPNCNAIVQKIRGTCDNMQCDMCKTHFCWECLEVAATHELVYTHLSEKHGTNYVNDEEREMVWQQMVQEHRMADALRQQQAQ